MVNIPFYKKILSYLYPVNISKGSSKINPVLDLFLYHNRLQLATNDALYSDGDKYRPLILAFNYIGVRHLKNFHSVLVLGTGLGSAVHILTRRHLYPDFILVDIDHQVLKMAMEHLPQGVGNKVTALCEDAGTFMNKNIEKYGILIVDIFIGRNVPDFVIEPSFLNACRNGVDTDGYFILNYMPETNEKWEKDAGVIRQFFPSMNIIEFGINKVIVAKV